jgi:glucose-6-phosphate isomerase
VTDLGVQVHGADHGELIERLVADRVASKLAAQDATLWGPEAESEASIRLSWTTLPTSSRPLLAEIEALQAALRSKGVDQVVLCGMGGSSLAPEVITRTAGVELTVLDSTDPAVIRRALDGDLARTVVVVSSKSGGTVETDSQRRAFVDAFTKAGIDAASRIVVVTDPGSPLSELAEKEGYRKVFLADPDVGGRYSALTAFGLVPSGLAGADIAELLDEAEAAMPALAADSPDNPALVLAAAMAGDKTRDKLAIVDLGSGITGFADWAEQLIAESTGKNDTGVLPVVVGADAPEVKWPAADVTVAALTGTTTGPAAVSGATGAGSEIGEPRVEVTGDLGAQLLLWETATAIAGRILGINPFDQPDVESAKKAARGLLDAQPEPEPAAFTDGVVEVRGSEGLLDGVTSLADAVQKLFDQLGDRGYVAVMAYADPVAAKDLPAVRNGIALRTERPTTFGWGPRFLHSTGQFHKGGPKVGVFVQVTAAAPVDVEIPDRPFSFGTLIAAQATGDASVLAALGRPVLRLHVTDPAGFADVVRALSQGGAR